MRSRLLSAVFLLGLIPSLAAQGTAPVPGGVTVSDAAYAEVSAIAYAALKQAAVGVRDALNNATSQDTPMILLTPELVDAQLALRSSIAQLDQVNERFCSLLRSPAASSPPPAPGAFRPESFFSGDVGSIASGFAAAAQLFTPHSASASVGLTPSHEALLADIIGAGRPLILPNLYLPSAAELATDVGTREKPCSRTFAGSSPSAVQDFATLWQAAETSATQLRAIRKPSDEVKAALAAWDDLGRTYLVADPKSGSVYAQMLRAQALARYLDPARKPVVLLLGVDAMGGTTSESGKTSFTSHVRYSGGVVVHYLAWQLSPETPMKPVAAGTITRTITNQTEADIQTLLNR